MEDAAGFLFLVFGLTIAGAFTAMCVLMVMAMWRDIF